jgi:hypothetical protein
MNGIINYLQHALFVVAFLQQKDVENVLMMFNFPCQPTERELEYQLDTEKCKSDEIVVIFFSGGR